MLEGQLSRRRVLASLGGLGVTGVAGCFNDSSETVSPIPGTTATGTTTRQTTSMTDREETSPEEVVTTTREGTPPPHEKTTTTTPGCSLPDYPAKLVSFNNVVDGAVLLSTDGGRLTGTITNPYLYELQNGEVTLAPPADDWEIDPVDGTTFETLAPQASQTAEWDVTVPSSPLGVYDLPVTVTYECGNDEAVREFTQTVRTHAPPLQWEHLASAPEYYDGLEADQDAPGELSLEAVDVELDLSEWADAREFQLKFGDYWPSDGWGALVERTQIRADGSVIHDVEADTEAELEYIIVDAGSQRLTETVEDVGMNWRVANENAYWVYQFTVPEGTSDLSATITVANGFDIDGREGIER